MGRSRRDQLEPKGAPELAAGRGLAAPTSLSPAPVPEPAEAPTAAPRVFLGKAIPRGYGGRPRLSLDAAASFATLVDTARARAAMEGRTLVYTVRWG